MAVAFGTAVRGEGSRGGEHGRTLRYKALAIVPVGGIEAARRDVVEQVPKREP